MTAVPLTMLQLREVLQGEPAVSTDWPASSLVPSWRRQWEATQRPQHSELEGEKTWPSPHCPSVSHWVELTEVSASPSLIRQL